MMVWVFMSILRVNLRLIKCSAVGRRRSLRQLWWGRFGRHLPLAMGAKTLHSKRIRVAETPLVIASSGLMVKKIPMFFRHHRPPTPEDNGEVCVRPGSEHLRQTASFVLIPLPSKSSVAGGTITHLLDMPIALARFLTMLRFTALQIIGYPRERGENEANFQVDISEWHAVDSTP